MERCPLKKLLTQIAAEGDAERVARRSYVEAQDRFENEQHGCDGLEDWHWFFQFFGRLFLYLFGFTMTDAKLKAASRRLRSHQDALNALYAQVAPTTLRVRQTHINESTSLPTCITQMICTYTAEEKNVP